MKYEKLKIFWKLEILKEFLSRPVTIRILLIVLSLIFIVGCSAESGTPPPSGPIGGGC